MMKDWNVKKFAVLALGIATTLVALKLLLPSTQPLPSPAPGFRERTEPPQPSPSPSPSASFKLATGEQFAKTSIGPLVTPECIFAPLGSPNATNAPCSATITARATDNRGAQTTSAPVTIYLLPHDRWPLMAQIEGKAEITLRVGDEHPVLARVWDQRGREIAWPIKWQASHFSASRVVTVGERDGIVRAIAKGEARVHATAQNITSNALRVKVR